MKVNLSKQHWIAQFQGEVEEQLSILEKSPKSKGVIIRTMVKSFYGKMINRDTYALISESTPENPRAKAFLTMAMYLWEYEARFSFCINILCFILTTNGHDLYDDYKKRYVTSFEDIEPVSISRKCEFLTHHGFEIFNENKNKRIKEFRKIRNDIAHYNIIINEDGKIKVYGNKTKSWQEVPLILIHSDLREFASNIILSIIQCFDNSHR